MLGSLIIIGFLFIRIEQGDIAKHVRTLFNENIKFYSKLVYPTQNKRPTRCSFNTYWRKIKFE